MHYSQSRRSLTLILLWAAIGHVAAAFAEESKTAAQSSGTKPVEALKAGAATDVDQENVDSPEYSHKAAVQVFDQMIEICKRVGDAENTSKMQALGSTFLVQEDQSGAVNVAKLSYAVVAMLLQKDELLTAREFMPKALRLAACVKKVDPWPFTALHTLAASLDVEFENYDSALQHITTALKTANDGPLMRSELISIRALHARVLRKMKRFDDAEKIYLDLLRDVKENPDGLEKDALHKLGVAHASVYADKGEFNQFVAAMPGGAGECVFDDGTPDYEGQALALIAAINAALEVGKHVKLTGERAEQLVEWRQRHNGAYSNSYIEAIELLAKVRVGQSRPDDAIKLLQKSAQLRAGLLGESHPSIARVQKEIDNIRKRELDMAEPIWTPPKTDSDSDSADRYGLGKQSNESAKK